MPDSHTLPFRRLPTVRTKRARAIVGATILLAGMSGLLINVANAAAPATTVPGAQPAADPASAGPAATAPTVGPAAPPDYAGYKHSVRVPFARPVDFDRLQGMHVRVSLNGGPPTVFQVDTGSVGVIVAAAEVPHIDPAAPEGSITYSSSGITLLGVWTPVTIAFVDAKDEQGRVPTAVVPVLAAKERRVTPGAVNANVGKPTMNPKVHMFGVGFGRGKDAHPERNPFANLTEMRDGKAGEAGPKAQGGPQGQVGTMRRGYAITRDGFTLGLTPADAGPGYLFEKLKERPIPADAPAARLGLKDWESARAWVSVNGVREPVGPVLLDTGLTNLMVGKVDPPADRELAAGTDFAVHLMDGRLSYAFKVGDEKNPTAPRRATWIKRADTPSLNTGLRALAAFDYLYDADGGYLGLRPTRVLGDAR